MHLLNRRTIQTAILSILLFAAAPSPATAQPSETLTIQPACTVPFRMTANGSIVQFDNGYTGCITWILTYSSSGFSALTLAVETAPDNAGAPGAWGNWGGTISAGVNPNTATTQALTTFGTQAATDYFRWIRVHLTAATGSGQINGTLYGFRNSPAGSGSGSGASSQNQLTDWQTTATATVWTMSTCTTTAPCVPRTNAHLNNPYTGAPYTCNYNSAQGTSGDVYEYLDAAGAWTFLYGNGNLASGAVTGCTAGINSAFQASISDFPDGSCPIYHWQIVGGAIVTTPLADAHGVACSVPSIAAGANVTFTRSGNTIVINGQAGSASAGGNGVFQEGNGSGGFVASSMTDAFGVVSLANRGFQVVNGMGVSLGQGFGITTCSSTATLQPNGWNVVNVTGPCTLSIAAPGFDGIQMDMLICENATGNFAVILPASLLGAGTINTVPNKCNYQTFRGSTGGGTLGGHTLNAVWWAMAPMVSY